MHASTFKNKKQLSEFVGCGISTTRPNTRCLASGDLLKKKNFL
jgi:hypothetical protein